MSGDRTHVACLEGRGTAIVRPPHKESQYHMKEDKSSEEPMKLEQVPEGKRCATCKKVKPLDAFGKQKRQEDGKSFRCRECWTWRQRKSNYGITRKDFIEMLESQNNRCAICYKEKPGGVRKNAADDWVVDHDHETGEVRGILCNKCNLVIGFAEEDIYTLQSAIEYLQGIKGIRTPLESGLNAVKSAVGNGYNLEEAGRIGYLTQCEIEKQINETSWRA